MEQLVDSQIQPSRANLTQEIVVPVHMMAGIDTLQPGSW